MKACRDFSEESVRTVPVGKWTQEISSLYAVDVSSFTPKNDYFGALDSAPTNEIFAKTLETRFGLINVEIGVDYFPVDESVRVVFNGGNMKQTMFEVCCPRCAKIGIATEENMRTGIACPNCQNVFLPKAPTWWEKQKANSPFLQYGWLFVLIVLIGMWIATISKIALFALAVLALLAFIAFQVYRIAQRK